VAAQTAYGIEAEVEGYGDAYDPQAMLFMDFRRHHTGVWDARRLAPGEEGCVRGVKGLAPGESGGVTGGWHQSGVWGVWGVKGLAPGDRGMRCELTTVSRGCTAPGGRAMAAGQQKEGCGRHYLLACSQPPRDQ
jgi:hypothetical protein